LVFFAVFPRARKRCLTAEQEKLKSRAGKVGISSAALPDQHYSDLKIAGKFDLFILLEFIDVLYI